MAEKSYKNTKINKIIHSEYMAYMTNRKVVQVHEDTGSK